MHLVLSDDADRSTVTSRSEPTVPRFRLNVVRVRRFSGVRAIPIQRVAVRDDFPGTALESQISSTFRKSVLDVHAPIHVAVVHVDDHDSTYFDGLEQINLDPFVTIRVFRMEHGVRDRFTRDFVGQIVRAVFRGIVVIC